MTTEKPEALRLADELELLQTPPTALAAIELRRLHAVETMAHLARAGHEQWFAECQRLHAEVQRLSAPQGVDEEAMPSGATVVRLAKKLEGHGVEWRMKASEIRQAGECIRRLAARVQELEAASAPAVPQPKKKREAKPLAYGVAYEGKLLRTVYYRFSDAELECIRRCTMNISPLASGYDPTRGPYVVVPLFDHAMIAASPQAAAPAPTPKEWPESEGDAKYWAAEATRWRKDFLALKYGTAAPTLDVERERRDFESWVSTLQNGGKNHELWHGWLARAEKESKSCSD